MLPTQQRGIWELRRELRDYVLYSGMGVICDYFSTWELVKPFLSSLDYKIISNFPVSTKVATSFATIVQSIAPPKPHARATAAESSDSPPFVIAVFVSGLIVSAWLNNLYTVCGEVNVVDDIIQPFLPQSAPHLRQIPKLFFITALSLQKVYLRPHDPPPQFPEDSDGNYCVVYHSIVTNSLSSNLMRKWVQCITDDLFVHAMTVQGAIEKSRSHLDQHRESLHYFTCLKNNLVLKK